MAGDFIFHVRINDGHEHKIAVKTSMYQIAAMAAPAILGLDVFLPIHVEIWVPELLPSYGPHHYIISENEFGQMVVKTAVKVKP